MGERMWAPSMPLPSEPSTRLSRVAPQEACFCTSTPGMPCLAKKPLSLATNSAPASVSAMKPRWALVTSGPAACAMCTPAGNFVCSAPSSAVAAVVFRKARRLGPRRLIGGASLLVVICVAVLLAVTSPLMTDAPLLVVDRKRNAATQALESALVRAAALPIGPRSVLATPSAVNGVARHPALQASCQLRATDKIKLYQCDSLGRRNGAAPRRSGLPVSRRLLQKICAAQKRHSCAHPSSSAAVITDCATSAIFLFSFIAVLRSSE